MELIQIKEKIKILELCNNQGFLTYKDKELLIELTYVVEQLSLHLVSKSFYCTDVNGRCDKQCADCNCIDKK